MSTNRKWPFMSKLQLGHWKVECFRSDCELWIRMGEWEGCSFKMSVRAIGNIVAEISHITVKKG